MGGDGAAAGEDRTIPGLDFSANVGLEEEQVQLARALSESLSEAQQQQLRVRVRVTMVIKTSSSSHPIPSRPILSDPAPSHIDMKCEVRVRVLYNK